MKTTQTPTIVETAKKFDLSRRVRAVAEFTNYMDLGNGRLLNKTNGEVYDADRCNVKKGWVGCNCADALTRVATMRGILETENTPIPCACKHRYIRQILSGKAISIGEVAFKAPRK